MKENYHIGNVNITPKNNKPEDLLILILVAILMNEKENPVYKELLKTIEKLFKIRVVSNKNPPAKPENVLGTIKEELPEKEHNEGEELAEKKQHAGEELKPQHDGENAGNKPTTNHTQEQKTKLIAAAMKVLKRTGAIKNQFMMMLYKANQRGGAAA